MPLTLWLCHADARQVFDLPKALNKFAGLWPRVGDPRSGLGRWRQVKDLPRIGVAKPSRKSH